MAVATLVRTLNFWKPKNGVSVSESSTTTSLDSLSSKRSASRATMPDYFSLTESQLHTKFHEIKLMEDERIHDAIVHKESSKWSMQAGVHAFELGRNRYANILPYDNNRVRLEVGEDFNDYINASHISLDLVSKRDYIATQGPMKATITHFWHMVMQQTVEGQDAVIVMVTPLIERHVKKCSKYWIDKVGEYVDLAGPEEGFEHDLRLQCVDFYDVEDIPGTHYTALRLEALNPETKEVQSSRTVHHLYYDQWTDFMKPGSWGPIHSLSNLSHTLNGEGNPLIVHCSAGVGRTGTFITLDYLFRSEQLLQTESDSDIVERIIKRLRQQRLLMVQSFDQFKFCYEALFEFFCDVSTLPSFPS